MIFANNADFVYVSFPSKALNNNISFLTGVDSDCEEKREQLIEGLRKRNTKVLNIREKMENDGLDIENLFYKTDHHWTTKAGLYAAQEITNFLKVNMSCQTESQNLEEKKFSYTY